MARASLMSTKVDVVRDVLDEDTLDTDVERLDETAIVELLRSRGWETCNIDDRTEQKRMMDMLLHDVSVNERGERVCSVLLKHYCHTKVVPILHKWVTLGIAHHKIKTELCKFKRSLANAREERDGP